MILAAELAQRSQGLKPLLLTRKMEISWACGSGPWPSGLVRAFREVLVRRLGPGPFCQVRVRGCGEFGEDTHTSTRMPSFGSPANGFQERT